MGINKLTLISLFDHVSFIFPMLSSMFSFDIFSYSWLFPFDVPLSMLLSIPQDFQFIYPNRHSLINNNGINHAFFGLTR